MVIFKKTIIFILLAFMLSACSTSTTPNKIRQGKQGEAIIDFTDEIRQKSVREFRDQIHQHQRHSIIQRIIINLHSGGGNLGHTKTMERIIEGLKKQNIQVITMVDNGRICASACTAVFSFGDIRLAGEKSRFMFHSPFMFYPSYDPNIEEKDPLVRHAQNMSIFYSREYLMDSYLKVDKKLAEYIRDDYIYKYNNEFWITGAELKKRFGRYITDII